MSVRWRIDESLAVKKVKMNHGTQCLYIKDLYIQLELELDCTISSA